MASDVMIMMALRGIRWQSAVGKRGSYAAHAPWCLATGSGETSHDTVKRRWLCSSFSSTVTHQLFIALDIQDQDLDEAGAADNSVGSDDDDEPTAASAANAIICQGDDFVSYPSGTTLSGCAA